MCIRDSHQSLLGGEVVGGVSAQAVQHMGQLGRLDLAAGGRALGQDIDKVNELAVLGVHLAKAGLKVVSPAKRGNPFSVVPADAPSPRAICPPMALNRSCSARPRAASKSASSSGDVPPRADSQTCLLYTSRCV